MMSSRLRLDGSGIYLRVPVRTDYRDWSQLREQSREHLVPWEPAWPKNANSRSDWRVRMSAWRALRQSGRAYAFLIFSKADDALCGGITLSNVRRGAAMSGTLGYWLGGPATGQGYMREATRLVCDWAFQTLQLKRIEAAAVLDNHRSHRVLEMSGFIKEGMATSYLEIAGERRDHVLFALTDTQAKTNR